MTFSDEINNCSSHVDFTSCSRIKFMEEYLHEKDEKALWKAKETATKLGEPITIEPSKLTAEEYKFAEEYLRQLAWSMPYRDMVNNVDAYLNGLSPAQASEFVRKKLAEKITAPRLSEYDPAVKSLVKNADDERGNKGPSKIEQQNLTFQGTFHQDLREAAIKYFEENKMYDNLREMVSSNKPGQKVEIDEEYRNRPEIAISSAQQKRFLEIFNQVDKNSNERVSEKELDAAIANPATSKSDREMLEVMKKFRERLAKSYDDSSFLPEWGISVADMQHIGKSAFDQSLWNEQGEGYASKPHSLPTIVWMGR